MSPSPHLARAALRAPGSRIQGATTTAYSQQYAEEEQRRRRLPAAATQSLPIGWADLRRPTSLLVARVLVFEYATLLAPCGPRIWAQRGRGRCGEGL